LNCFKELPESSSVKARSCALNGILLMVDLSDRRSISQSISAISDPRETAVVLAARAVLRALPLIVDEYDIKKSKGALEFPFKIFSAANITWAVARYPELRERLRPQTRRIHIFQYGVVSAAMSFALAAAERAAGAAPFAAGQAAADAASGAIEATRHAFSGALAAADAALANDFDCLAKGIGEVDFRGRAARRG
jgi:hypothetical protein